MLKHTYALVLLLFVSHHYNHIYDMVYRDKRDWSPGKVSSVDISLVHYPKGLWLKSQIGIRMRLAASEIGSNFDFTKIEAQSRLNILPSKKTFIKLRLLGGMISGTPSLQDRFYLFGGMELEGILSPLADGKGTFSPQDHLQVSGGGGMRGYYGQHLAGKVIAALNMDAKVPYFPLELFFDTGNIWDDYVKVHVGKLRHDAGVSIDLGVIAFHFPLWVSEPSKGEKNFKFRWVVSVSSPTLTIGI